MYQGANNGSVNFCHPLRTSAFISYVTPGTLVVTQGVGERVDPGPGASPFLPPRCHITNTDFTTFDKAAGHVTESEDFGPSAMLHAVFRGDRCAMALGAT